eukprot:gene10037-13494_t
MSSFSNNEEKKSSSSRRRRPPTDSVVEGVKDGGESKSTGPKKIRRRPKFNGPPREPREKSGDSVERVKIEHIPVPTAVYGKTIVGVVATIMRRGSAKYGFIAIVSSPTVEATREDPRIYFSFKNLVDSSLTLRKGYSVSFKVETDESNRPYAGSIELTEEGKKQAEIKEAEIAEKRSELKVVDVADGAAAVAPTSGVKGAPRERRERPKRVFEEKIVSLKVTCEGKTETKTIDFNVNQSIGKLKIIATKEFDSPSTYSVYHVAAAGATPVFLTKSLLIKIAPGEFIHLAESKSDA